MICLTLIVAFLPSILAEPIGYELKVNLLTSIPDLIVNAPNTTPTSYNSVSERKMYEDNILSVVGDMVFTETDKSQKYDVSFGGHWSGVAMVKVKNAAGVREADVGITYKEPAASSNDLEVIMGWSKVGIPDTFALEVNMVDVQIL